MELGALAGGVGLTVDLLFARSKEFSKSYQISTKSIYNTTTGELEGSF